MITGQMCRDIVNGYRDKDYSRWMDNDDGFKSYLAGDEVTIRTNGHGPMEVSVHGSKWMVIKDIRWSDSLKLILDFGELYLARCEYA